MLGKHDGLETTDKKITQENSGSNAPRRGFPKQRRGYSDMMRGCDGIGAKNELIERILMSGVDDGIETRGSFKKIAGQ